MLESFYMVGNFAFQQEQKKSFFLPKNLKT